MVRMFVYVTYTHSVYVSIQNLKMILHHLLSSIYVLLYTYTVYLFFLELVPCDNQNYVIKKHMLYAGCHHNPNPSLNPQLPHAFS